MAGVWDEAVEFLKGEGAKVRDNLVPVLTGKSAIGFWFAFPICAWLLFGFCR